MIDEVQNLLNEVSYKEKELDELKTKLFQARNLRKKNLREHPEIIKYFNLHPRDQVAVYVKYMDRNRFLDSYENYTTDEDFFEDIQEGALDNFLKLSENICLISCENNDIKKIREYLKILLKDEYAHFYDFFADHSDLVNIYDPRLDKIFLTEDEISFDLFPEKEEIKYIIVHPDLYKILLNENLIKIWKS